MREFLYHAGAFYLAFLAIVATMVAYSLLLERRDRKARDREQLEREQTLHVIRFGSMRAAGTLSLHSNRLPRGRHHA